MNLQATNLEDQKQSVFLRQITLNLGLPLEM